MRAAMMDTRPLRHRLDPLTSHEAAERVVASGVAATHRARVLVVLERHPGATAGEMAMWSGLDAVEVRRRLTDAKREGQAVPGRARRCSVEGTRQREWRLPDRQGVLL